MADEVDIEIEKMPHLICPCFRFFMMLLIEHVIVMICLQVTKKSDVVEI
jgi:hypothetical protein